MEVFWQSTSFDLTVFIRINLKNHKKLGISKINRLNHIVNNGVKEIHRDVNRLMMEITV